MSQVTVRKESLCFSKFAQRSLHRKTHNPTSFCHLWLTLRLVHFTMLYKRHVFIINLHIYSSLHFSCIHHYIIFIHHYTYHVFTINHIYIYLFTITLLMYSLLLIFTITHLMYSPLIINIYIHLYLIHHMYYHLSARIHH